MTHLVTTKLHEWFNRPQRRYSLQHVIQKMHKRGQLLVQNTVQENLVPTSSWFEKITDRLPAIKQTLKILQLCRAYVEWLMLKEAGHNGPSVSGKGHMVETLNMQEGEYPTAHVQTANCKDTATQKRECKKDRVNESKTRRRWVI